MNKIYLITVLTILTLLASAGLAQAYAVPGIAYLDASKEKTFTEGDLIEFEYAAAAPYFEYPINYKVDLYDQYSGHVETLVSWTTTHERLTDKYYALDSTGLATGMNYEIVMTVYSTDNNYQEATIAFFLEEAPPEPVVVTHPNDEMYVGETELFTATGGRNGNFQWRVVSGGCNIISSTTANPVTVQGTFVSTCTVEAQDRDSSEKGQGSIDIIESPYVYITHPNAQLYVSQEETFTAHGGTSYSWQITSGNCIAVSPTNSDTFIVKGTNTGDCNVKVTDISGESATDKVNYIDTTGLMSLTPIFDTAYPEQGKTFTASGVLGAYIWEIVPSSCSISPNKNTAEASGQYVGQMCQIKVIDSLGLGEKTAQLEIISLPDITVTPEHTTLYTIPGYNIQQYEATGGVQGNSVFDYIWEVSGSGNCEIDEAGMLIANSVGQCYITAKDKGSSATGSATADIVSVTDVVVTPSSATKKVGETQRYTATGGMSGEYSWSIISGSTSCTLAHGSSSEYVDVIAQSQGQCTIKAKDTGSDKSDTAVLNVEEIILPDLIINPDYREADIGDKYNFDAINGKSDNYYWSISSTTNSCELQVSGSYLQDDAKVVALKEGTCTLTVQNNGETATATIVVNPDPYEQVIIDPKTTTKYEGESQQFTATGGTPGCGYVWYASGDCTVSTSGYATAKTLPDGEEQSLCEVFVFDPCGDANDPNSMDVAEMIVLKEELPVITVIPTSATIKVGETQQYTATGGCGYTWNYVGTGCIIDQNGKLTGYSEGSCTVYAFDKCSEAFGTATATIINPTITVSPSTATLKEGETQQYTATGGCSYTWSVTNNYNDACHIDANGLLTAENVGSCTVVANDVCSTASGTATATVQENIADITVSPKTASIKTGNTQQFTATGGCGYIWTVSNSASCEIDANGLLTGNSPGSCTVKAQDKCSSGFDTASVTVYNPTITVSPSTATLKEGETQQYTATGGCGYDWATYGPCSINSNGLLTGEDVGVCEVLAFDRCSTAFGTATATVQENIADITVNPKVATIMSGDTQQFSATGGCGYIWTVSNSGSCEIDANGLLTGNSPGSCTVKAQDKCSSGFDTASLTVYNPTITVSPSTATLKEGETQQYTATGGCSYTWSVTNNYNDACHIDANGLLTAENVGSCTVVANDVCSTASGTATAVVEEYIADITVSPKTASIKTAGTQQFSATGGCGYIWTVSGSACEIDANGLLTGNSPGSCTVKAQDKCSSGFDTASVTVHNPTITVSPSTATLKEGETQQYTATGGCGYDWATYGPCSIDLNGLLTGEDVGVCDVLAFDRCSTAYGSAEAIVEENIADITVSPKTASIKTGNTQQFSATGGCAYTWTVSGSACKIDANGLLTGNSPGSCTVKAQDKCSSGFDTASVTVHNPTITVSPSTATLKEGETQQYTATGGCSYTWSVTNNYNDACHIDANGLLTAENVGSCTVVANDRCSTAFGTAHAVVEEYIADITVSPKIASIKTGDTQQFSATGGCAYTWTVSGSACEIDANGLLTGNSPGSCTVTAQDKCSSGSDTATVTVTNPIITVQPPQVTLKEGETQQYSATGGCSYTWSVTGTSCQIDANGLLTAENVGSCTVVANDRCSTAFGTAHAVVEEYIADITVSPKTADIKVGNTQQFSATGGCAYTWTVSGSACEIDANGLLTGNSPGSCTVTAYDKCSSGSDTATVTVTNPTITVQPPMVTLKVGDTQQYSAFGGCGYTWSVTGTSCQIDANGLLTGKSAGQCTVTANDKCSTAYGTATAVIEENIADITISPKYADILVNDRQQFSATGGCGYTWSVEGDACTIDANGLLTGNAVGQCTVTAHDKCSLGFDTATVNVRNPDITVLPPVVSIEEGEKQQFMATGGCGYEWSVTGPCTIDYNGLLTGDDAGVCMVRADDVCTTAYGTAHVTVNEPYVADIYIVPPQVTLYESEQQQFTAYGADPGCGYTWSVSGTCSIDQDGLLTAESVGNCEVTAKDTCTPGEGHAQVTVLEIPEIVVSPPEATVYSGETQQYTASGAAPGCDYIWTAVGSCFVDASGLATGASVGDCQIIAEDSCAHGTDSAVLHVVEMPELIIEPKHALVDIGKTQQYTASGAEPGCSYAWSVNGPCTIDQSGLLTGIDEGACEIVVEDSCYHRTASASATVINSSNYPISAEIVAVPTSGEKPLYVEFEAIATGYGKLSYDWNKGYPYPISHGKTAYHTYRDQGVYPVYLTVTDELGRTATDVEYITVYSHGDMKDDPRSRIIVNGLETINEGSIMCGTDAEFYISLENTGSELEEFRIMAVVQELGIYKKLSRFDFETGMVTKILPLEIPCDVEEGLYSVEFSFSNDEFRRTVYRDFMIEGGCLGSKSSTGGMC